MDKIYNNEDDYEKIIQNSGDSVISILCSGKQKARERAETLISNKDLLSKIKYFQTNDIPSETRNLIESEFNNKKWKHFEKYLDFNYIKQGVCYLNADIPDSIKNLIIDLVEKRYIRIVVATSLIISGIDLPFDITLMDSHKINKKNMTPNEVVNYFGRGGRIGHSKKAYAVGFSYIKINKKNNKWWKKNKEEILKKLNSSCDNIYDDAENKTQSFIEASYEKYYKEKKDFYIFDPRINPETTLKIVNLMSIEDYKNIVSSLIKWTSSSKKETNIKQTILCLFILYNINDYVKNVIESNIITKLKNSNMDAILSFLRTNSSNSTLNLNYILTNLSYFVKSNFRLDVSLKMFINVLSNKKINKINFTKKIEFHISNNKNFGKYYLINFINHLYLVTENEKKYTNFTTIINFYVTDYDFFKFLICKKYIKILSLISVNNKALKTWKNINKFDNDIKKIYECLSKLKAENELKKIIKSYDNFFESLQNFIKNIAL